MPHISECLGSWRPDFLVEEDEHGEEQYRITEINARFCFNGFILEAYGQEALNRCLAQDSELVSATDPEKVMLQDLQLRLSWGLLTGARSLAVYLAFSSRLFPCTCSRVPRKALIFTCLLMWYGGATASNPGLSPQKT